MTRRRIIIALIGAAVAVPLFIACGHFSGRGIKTHLPPTMVPAVQQDAPQEKPGVLPGVMELDGRITANRAVSAEQTVTSQGWDAFVNGQTWTNGTSGTNVEVDGTSLTLRAYDTGEYAYAVYGQVIGTDPKPLQTLISSEVCKFSGGRDDEVPLLYVIGIADYTIDSWRWFGPFDKEDVLVTVNSASLRSRFKSPSNNFYLCVLTSNGKTTSSLPAGGLVADFPFQAQERGVSQSGDSPAGLTINEIVTTTADGLETDPAVVSGLKTTADVGGVTISWDRNFDPDVFLYQVFRDDLDDPELPVLLVGVNAPITTYRDDTGVPGKEYLYLVRARNNAGFGGMSLRRGTRGLAAPSVTASDGASVDYIRLSWDAVAGAVNGYRLFRAALPTGPPQGFITVDSSTFTFDDNSPPMDVAMWYWVQPLGEDAAGPLGGPDHGIRPALDPLEVIATDGDFPGYVALAWADDGTADEFRVYRDTDTDDTDAVYVGSVFPQTIRDVTYTYDDTASPWATDMYYFVREMPGNTRGTGDWGQRNLMAPQDVSASQGTDALHVTVSWSAVNHATRYKVFRTDNPIDPSPPEIAQVSAPLTTFSDSPPGWGTTEGLKYYYGVCALHSGPDNERSAMSLYSEGGCALGVPQNVSASDGIFPNKVVVTWSTVSQADGYKVYRDGGFLAQVSAPAVTYTDNSVVQGTQYSYAVSAFVASGEGEQSAADTGFAAVPPQASLTADPTKGDAPLTVNFDAGGSSDPDGSIVKYEWDWSNDGTYEMDSGADPTVSCQYADPGNYACRLRVTDNNGATGVATIGITAYIAEWVHTWGGSGDEEIVGVFLDSDGFLYGAGFTFSFGAGEWDTLVVKYDPNGNAVWRKTWGGNNNDSSNAISPDGNGNFYVAGTTMSFGAGDYDVAILKYSMSGNLQWARTWGGNGPDVGSGIVVKGDGNILVTGCGTSFGSGSYDDILLEYSPSGTLLRQRTWGGVGHDNSGYHMSLDGEGNWLLAGDSDINGGGYYDVLVTKYSPTGNFLWSKIWDISPVECAMGIRSDLVGNIYIGGYTSYSELGGVCLLKYAANGDLLWQRIWGGDNYDYGYCLAVDAVGNSFLGCPVYSNAVGESDVAVIKYSPSGDLLWQVMWGDTALEQARGITLGDNGTIYVVGYTKQNATGTWTDPGGISSPVTGNEGTLAGTLNTPTGTQGSPTGTESSPIGATDTGGGNEDILIIKMRDQDS